MLQDEVYLIKENLRKSFGEENWLTCHDHLWLEEDANRFALRERKSAQNNPVVIEYNTKNNLVDIEGITVNKTTQKDEREIK